MKPVNLMPRENYLKTTEVAKLLRVSPRAVADWAKTGKIATVRTPGGQWRIPESAIEPFLGLVDTEQA